jgi:hypothetical protein
VLYAERKRQQALADREALGETLWSEAIERPAMVKIADVWKALRNQHPYSSMMDSTVKRLMTRSLGVEDPSYFPNDFIDVMDTDLALSYIEAVYMALEISNMRSIFEEQVNEVFNAHRVAFRLVKGQIVPFSSDELHVEVVEPALRLLIGDSRFGSAAATYVSALKEISKDEASNAITDAGTALQETLQALGCSGNALGPLIKDAKRKGLIAAHDQALAAGIEKFLDWASADRSEKGDAHKHSDASLDDAWLMVHIVGALIVRLAGSPRAGVQT